MELSKQVVSLEIAKKLKELGVKQDSVFVWLYRNYKISMPPQEDWQIELRQTSYHKEGEIYSAFTVAELGEMLPTNTATFRETTKNKLFVCTRNELSTLSLLSFRAETEADARGKTLIYLLENKLM